MLITVVYDNDKNPNRKELKSDWGFSALIEGNENVLFDTGTKPKLLSNNMDILDIDAGSVDKVVLSHEHGDHIGGLSAVLPDISGDVEVFIPSSFSRGTKIEIKKMGENVEVIDVNEPVGITKDIMSTGELPGKKNEQSLMIKREKGLFVLTGCAHPGLDNIMERASEFGDIYGVMGGFHGFDKFEIMKDLEQIIPCHCTEYKKKIRKKFPDEYMSCYVGLKVKV
ncbi:MAG: MBL fold metallo-hydrolase [Candidatus Saliniplasma sp.]